LRIKSKIFSLKKNNKKLFFFPLQKLSLTGNEFFNCIMSLSKILFKIENLKTKKNIAILYDNSVEYLIISFYIMLKQHTLVPLNPQLASSEIIKIYKQSDAICLITGKNMKKKVKSIKNKIIFNFHPNLKKINKNLSFYKIFKKERDNKSILLLYTSGSTGTPKGSLLTEKNILSNSQNIARHHKLNRNTNTLVLMPMFHNNGFIISFMSTFLAGGSTVIAPANLIIYKFWEIIKKFSISYTSLMPSVLSMLLSYAGKKKNTSLKIIACGGQKLSRVLLSRFEKKFKTKIIEHYGLTETTAISSVMNLKKRNLKSVGTPIKGTEIKLYDDKLKILKKRGYGEICISGKNVFLGYYKNNKLNSEKRFKNFFRSGDYGQFDKDKNLYFASRKDFLIIKGGENIYPAEIENTIYQFEKVNECAVVGYKDKIYGEEIYSFVKFNKYKASYEKKLNNFLIKNLARFKLPKKIFYFEKDLKIKDFPKTTTKKIKYKELKNIISNEI
tara:strand:+ start:31003 stop:32502 length:1500 start_codon:yes stop_codon:yes gene_type:complete